STRRQESTFGMEMTSMSENRGGHGGDQERIRESSFGVEMTSMSENRDEGDSEDEKKRRKERKDVTGRQFFSLPRSIRQYLWYGDDEYVRK
ncbi:hypothetical protein PoB_007240000, partial [Plakobranchus ocellatus]